MRGGWGRGGVAFGRVALGLALCWAGCSDPASAPVRGGVEAGSEAAYQEIDVAQLAALGGSVTILDVRTPLEFGGAHVPGAVNLPLGALEPGHPTLEALDPEQPVYVICATGRRSARAVERLSEQGFQAINVEGGTRAWRRAGHPTE